MVFWNSTFGELSFTLSLSRSQAANPSCLLEDFVRWYSPRDWIEDGETEDGGESPLGTAHDEERETKEEEVEVEVEGKEEDKEEEQEGEKKEEEEVEKEKEDEGEMDKEEEGEVEKEEEGEVEKEEEGEMEEEEEGEVEEKEDEHEGEKKKEEGDTTSDRLNKSPVPFTHDGTTPQHIDEVVSGESSEIQSLGESTDLQPLLADSLEGDGSHGVRYAIGGTVGSTVGVEVDGGGWEEDWGDDWDLVGGEEGEEESGEGRGEGAGECEEQTKKTASSIRKLVQLQTRVCST